MVVPTLFSVTLALGYTSTTFRLSCDTDGLLSNPIMHRGDLVDIVAFQDSEWQPIVTQAMVIEHIQDDGRFDTLILRVTQFQKLRLRGHDNLKYWYSIEN